jgi:hypothetical protein
MERPIEVIDNEVIVKPALPDVSVQTPTRVCVTMKGHLIWGDIGAS